jgi:hypothetical protein
VRTSSWTTCDRQDFLKTLAEACQKTGWRVQAYCLIGELRQETAAAKAERLLGEELRRRGWQEAGLAARRTSDAGKLEVAGRLRRETTLSLKQIVERLHLATPRSASVRPRRATKAPTRPAPGQCHLPILKTMHFARA